MAHTKSYHKIKYESHSIIIRMKRCQKRTLPSADLCWTAAEVEAAHSMARESVNMNVSDIVTT